MESKSRHSWLVGAIQLFLQAVSCWLVEPSTSRAIKEKCLREGSGSQLREGRSSYGLRTLLRMRLENSLRVVLVRLSLLPLARWRTMTRALNAPLCPPLSLTPLPLASIQTLTNTRERKFQIQEQILFLKYTYKYPSN